MSRSVESGSSTRAITSMSRVTTTSNTASRYPANTVLLASLSKSSTLSPDGCTAASVCAGNVGASARAMRSGNILVSNTSASVRTSATRCSIGGASGTHTRSNVLIVSDTAVERGGRVGSIRGVGTSGTRSCAILERLSAGSTGAATTTIYESRHLNVKSLNESNSPEESLFNFVLELVCDSRHIRDFVCVC